MNKIIGLIMTYNNLHFFKCVLQQMLDFCDEVILIEGCHFTEYPKESTDGTCEYIKTLKHPKLKIIPDFERNSDRYDVVQLELRRRHSEESKYWKPGNWILQWDDDILFFNKDLEILKTVLMDERIPVDTVIVRERRFAYNFRFNILMPYDFRGFRCKRITDGCKYMSGVSQLYYKDGSRYLDAKNLGQLDNAACHHYLRVRTSDRVKLRWELSVNKGCIKNKHNYKIWEKIKWDKDEDILTQKDDFNIVLGTGERDGILSIYNGKHPEVLDNHPWRYINDVRDIV